MSGEPDEVNAQCDRRSFIKHITVSFASFGLAIFGFNHWFDENGPSRMREEVANWHESGNWLTERYPYWVANYPNEYVAVYDRQIVDHDRDLDQLSNEYIESLIEI